MVVAFAQLARLSHGMLRSFVQLNQKASSALDSILPSALREDGNATFHTMIPPLVREGMVVYDLGGGSRPLFSPEFKQQARLTVVGLDLSQEELDAAPAGSYDRAIAADLTTFRGEPDGDLVICQATLEHVDNTDGALAAIASVLKPGGIAAIFVPCRNAWFARLNLMLPQRLKEKLLFTLIPEKGDGHEGFPAYYNRCTPKDFTRMAASHGMTVEIQREFWKSSYFSVLVPFYAVWRAWTLLGRYVIGPQACETFAMILRKAD
jgi:2-polyprenyl-6-hydroxyphenyl methylase/3-demethylubiquinone-9 3-methyltransferase